MRPSLLAALFVFATTSQAFAIPGQSVAQLAAWGKSNAALHGFKPSMDQNTGGTVYMATVTIDGLGSDFSSEPVSGVVPQEYVAFRDVNESWQLAKHPGLILDTVRVVYGAAYANDFQHATRVPLHGRTVAWRGAKLSYAVLGAAFFTIDNAEFPAVLKNIHACDALACED